MFFLILLQICQHNTNLQSIAFGNRHWAELAEEWPVAFHLLPVVNTAAYSYFGMIAHK